MTETTPGCWPSEAEDRNESMEDEASRPSTMETYATPYEEDSEEEDKVVERQDNAKDSLRKLGMTRIPELPAEIRETYAQLPLQHKSVCNALY